MAENIKQNLSVPVSSLSEILKEIERQVLSDRAQNVNDSRTVKDLRRTFDQESSRMNQAIFHDHTNAEIHREALRTVCTLVEILGRTKVS